MMTGPEHEDATVRWSRTLPTQLLDEPTLSTRPAGTGSERFSSARYRVLGEAGRGGMAVVLVAHDSTLGRNVAIKALSEDVGSDDDFRVRFFREVQITAQLDHPHVIPVYALEAADGGRPAYSMKLIEGETFGAYLDHALASHREGRQPDEAHALAARLEHFLKVCDAIAYAHGKGVVHRDLKPANVMIGRHNEVYVMDWGICRVVDDADDASPASVELHRTDAATTRIGDVVGTPSYMAPEQAQGDSHRIGPHSDQCALGLMLHELVTLESPYGGRTALEVLENAAHGRIRPMRPALRGVPVPRELKAIVARATARRIEDRYASVSAFASDIRRYLRGESVAARPDNLWQAAARFLARHRQFAMTSLLGIIAGAAVIISLLLWRHEQVLQAERMQEQRLGELVNLVVRKGDRLQTRMLLLQGELDSLAAIASQLLVHGRESDERFYWLDDYRRADRMPADFAMHPGFDDPVSLEHGVWVLAPGIDPAAVEPSVRRLLNLRRQGAELFEHAREVLGSDVAADGHAGASGVSEFWVALDSGVTYRYPGGMSLAEGFDGRDRPWYREALQSTRSFWGRPYVNASEGGIRLPVSHAIREAGEAANGVVSMTLRLGHLVRNLQTEQTHPAVREVMLLDGDGMVIAAAGLLHPQHLDGDGLSLTPFPDPQLFQHLTEADVGHFETQAFGAREIVVFDRVDPLGWIVVAMADPERLFER